jgi:hypothetical protein
MFLGNMREATAAEIKIEGHSVLAFKALLEYIYTDRVENVRVGFANMLCDTCCFPSFLNYEFTVKRSNCFGVA